MKVGDKVTIRDCSWAQTIVRGKMENTCDSISKNTEQHWTVVETGCSFSLKLDITSQPLSFRNDTVIQADDGRVMFIHNRFLKLVDPSHVWKHGDVLRTNLGRTLMCIRMCDSVIRLISLGKSGQLLLDPLGVPGILANSVFLFNIKDKL